MGWQSVTLVEHHADISPFWVYAWIAVVLNETRLQSVQRMVPADVNITTGMPEGAALAVEDVPRDYVFI